MVRERSSASQTYDKKLTGLSLKGLPGIKSCFEACCFNNQNGKDIFIYQGFIVIYNS